MLNWRVETRVTLTREGEEVRESYPEVWSNYTYEQAQARVERVIAQWRTKQGFHAVNVVCLHKSAGSEWTINKTVSE